MKIGDRKVVLINDDDRRRMKWNSVELGDPSFGLECYSINESDTEFVTYGEVFDYDADNRKVGSGVFPVELLAIGYDCSEEDDWHVEDEEEPHDHDETCTQYLWKILEEEDVA